MVLNCEIALFISSLFALVTTKVWNDGLRDFSLLLITLASLTQAGNSLNPKLLALYDELPIIRATLFSACVTKAMHINMQAIETRERKKCLI